MNPQGKGRRVIPFNLFPYVFLCLNTYSLSNLTPQLRVSNRNPSWPNLKTEKLNHLYTGFLPKNKVPNESDKHFMVTFKGKNQWCQ